MTDRVPTYNWQKIHQGADWSAEIIVKDGNRNVMDITGWTAKMQVRERPGSPLLMELSTENGGIVITGASGSIGFVMTDDQAELLQFSKAKYDLRVIDGSGNVAYLIKGDFPADQHITEG